MTTKDSERMVALDAEIRNAIAHEGAGSPLVAGLLDEQEALLALWLHEAEQRHAAHLAER